MTQVTIDLFSYELMPGLSISTATSQHMGISLVIMELLNGPCGLDGNDNNTTGSDISNL